MLNNKGQSLVLFILIIPILLGIMVLVIDCGNVLSQKNEINNVIEYVIDYGLDEINTDEIALQKELETLLQYNLNTTNNKITIFQNQIKISSKKEVKGIFSKILNIDGFNIESEYQGYLKKTKKIIRKVK